MSDIDKYSYGIKGTKSFREDFMVIIWHELGRISSIWIAGEKRGNF